MPDIYRAMVRAAAGELERAIRAAPFGSRIYVWSIPTSEERNGALVAGAEPPEPFARCVRPSDNGASTWERWESVPYSAMESILWQACRREPILPIAREIDDGMGGTYRAGVTLRV
jgi:hypothetical protein